jgi:aspartyl-tRNA(Asn)/glutamyl-tRNA(Gln) amidotransferase subunit B
VELPDAKKARFIKDMGLTAYDAMVICENKETADFFEEAAKGHDAKKVANWLMGDFFAMLNEKKLELKDSPVTAKNLGALVELITQNVINGKTAKDVFAIMAETGENPEKIVEEKGLKQVTDTGAIEKLIDDLLASATDNVNAYRNGKVGLFGWFVGQIMKQSQGKANPGVVNELLKKKLG